MMVLGGGQFLMSEVTLYAILKIQDLHHSIQPCRVDSLIRNAQPPRNTMGS